MRVRKWSATTEEDLDMKTTIHGTLRFWKEDCGQDMIEYSLLMAAVAIVVAGFLPPSIMPSISTIFSKVMSSFNAS
jgi:Flp pilus assembly pilin Flp